MLYAAGGVEAWPNGRGECPQCGDELVAKCGEVVEWHWAHKSKDCDPWSEPESEWHRTWKNCFDKQHQEVVLPPHRADVKINNVVIEFQKSNISQGEIRQREKFYGDMVWVLNTVDFRGNIELRRPTPKPPAIVNHSSPLSEGYFTFRWRHPRKSWFAAERPLFFDIGIGSFERDDTGRFSWCCLPSLPAREPMMFRVKKLHANVPCGGWGVFVTRAEFLNHYKDAERLQCAT